MIEINLLPEELKPKDEKLIIEILPRLLCYCLPLVFALIVLSHLFVGGLGVIRARQYSALRARMEELGPQRQTVDVWLEKYNIASQRNDKLSKLLSERPSVSDKMLILSESLLKGVWFNGFQLNENKLDIRGSIVSLKDDHISHLNIFLEGLKQNETFFKDFVSLEIGRAKMRKVGGFPVMDFSLEGKLK